MAAININREMLKNEIEGEKPILVDFWAPWCGYCRRIGPVYEKIAEAYGENIIVAKVNVDEEPQLSEEERIEVLPTLVLYKKGEAIGSVVAPESKAAIERFINETLEN